MQLRAGDTWAVLASIVESLVRWVEPAFADAGYVIVAVAVLLERSVFIGLIVPGDIILALGGVYASQSKMSLLVVIVIGCLAAIAGESTGYWLGRRFGRGLIHRIPLVRRLEGRFENAEDYFRRHGGKTVAIGRYATAAGAFVPFTAGVGRMRYPRFLAFDIPAIIVWATGISLFGYAFGKNLAFVDRSLSRFGYVVLALVIGFFAGRFLYKRLRAGKSPRTSSPTKGPSTGG
jgi:membrane-associated protein